MYSIFSRWKRERSSSVVTACNSWWGGCGFDPLSVCPLPTGWVGVSIMWLAETEVTVSPLWLCVAARRIIRRQSWDHPRDSLVADEDFKKPTNQTNKPLEITSPWCLREPIISFAHNKRIYWIVSPQAPATMKSVLQAAWLLTVGMGNFIVILAAEARLVAKQVTLQIFSQTVSFIILFSLSHFPHAALFCVCVCVSL